MGVYDGNIVKAQSVIAQFRQLRNRFYLNQVFVKINKEDSTNEVAQINKKDAVKKGFVFLKAKIHYNI